MLGQWFFPSRISKKTTKRGERACHVTTAMALREVEESAGKERGRGKSAEWEALASPQEGKGGRGAGLEEGC